MHTEDIHSKLDHFFERHVHLNFPDGHIILPANSDAPGVYYIVKGLVRQYTLTPNGQEVVVNIYKPGAFFPMIIAMTGVQNSYFFEAIDETEVYLAPLQETITFLKEEPDVLFDLLRRLYIGIDGLLQQLTINAVGTTSQKVIAALVMAAKRFGQIEGTKATITRKFSHKEIGTISGSSRESVTRTLSDLQEAGLISIDKKIITIPDLGKLQEELV